jgi:hypothetical protein
MCGCHFPYPGFVCDYHRREREHAAGNHRYCRIEFVPLAEFEAADSVPVEEA